MATQTSRTINWFTAPAVPTEILQARAAGKEIPGKIVTGPMGQTTYIGRPMKSLEDESWGEGLKAISDH